MVRSLQAQNRTLKAEMDELSACRTQVEEDVMFGGQDPSDYVCSSLAEFFEFSKDRVSEICSTSGQSKLHRVSRYIPRKTDEDHALASARIKRIKANYLISSKTRKDFDQITTIAFMKSPPSFTNAYSKVRASKWFVDFKLVTTSDPSIWDVVGYDETAFHDWWTTRKRISKFDAPVSQEWMDMKALYGGIVCLLDMFQLPELDDTPLDGDLKKIKKQVSRSAVNLAQSMSFPEHFTIISEFLGIFAPFVHVSIICIKSIAKSLNEDRLACRGNSKLAIDLWTRKVVSVELLSNILAEKSEILPKAQRPNILTPIPEAPTEPDNVNDIESQLALMALESLPSFDQKALENLGLRHISLSPNKGKPLGFGSYAVVHVWATSGGKSRFAVKVPVENSGLTHQAIWNKVGREALVWSRLHHENILTLRGFHMLPGNIPALVTDICDWNLKDFVKECAPVTPHERLVLLRGVVNGLVYLHSEGIAHGDLRASNILVKMNEGVHSHTAMLIDFGASYFLNGESIPESVFRTTTGQIGNPNWLSPELLKMATTSGDVSKPIRACISKGGDMYSFGCVFLEVMHERDPYQSFKTEEERRTKKLSGHFPATLAETSATYYEFLCSLWAPQPDDRPSATSAYDSLDAFLHKFQ